MQFLRAYLAWKGFSNYLSILKNPFRGIRFLQYPCADYKSGYCLFFPRMRQFYWKCTFSFQQECRFCLQPHLPITLWKARLINCEYDVDNLFRYYSQICKPNLSTFEMILNTLIYSHLKSYSHWAHSRRRRNLILLNLIFFNHTTWLSFFRFSCYKTAWIRKIRMTVGWTWP